MQAGYTTLDHRVDKLLRELETIRRELGCKPGDSVIDFIRRLKQRQPTQEVEVVR